MTFTSNPIELPIQDGEHPFQRADLLFYGVDHSGASFEARVFLNRPDATTETPRTEEQGYVGSFYMFGHGGCFGDVGHCDVPRERVSPFDRRGEHQLTPRTKIVVITESLRRLIDRSGHEGRIQVSVVPVVRPSPFASSQDAADVLKIDRVQLITYE